MDMSLMHMLGNMGLIAWCVVITLLVCSIYSIAVMIDRFRTFRVARSQSLEFLPALVKCLKENQLEAAVDTARKHHRSHIAKVVSAGLMEILNQKGESATSSYDVEGAVQRSLEMSTALTAAEMKKGLGGLATIGSTAPFIGLFGTVFGIINAFTGMAATGSGGLAAVSAGIAEALITTGFGIGVAIPAVMAFNYFTGSLERFQIEMTNSSAELMDFFMKKRETLGHATR
jgi:biopolymer transport protein ExbB/biopolymer transport protein TolQ